MPRWNLFSARRKGGIEHAVDLELGGHSLVEPLLELYDTRPAIFRAEVEPIAASQPRTSRFPDSGPGRRRCSAPAIIFAPAAAISVEASISWLAAIVSPVATPPALGRVEMPGCPYPPRLQAARGEVEDSFD